MSPQPDLRGINAKNIGSLHSKVTWYRGYFSVKEIFLDGLSKMGIHHPERLSR
jgi:hypothetical protein